MSRPSISVSRVLLIQPAVLGAFALAYFAAGSETHSAVSRAIIGRTSDPVVRVTREEPLRVAPLYDDPEVVSDEELAAVLRQIRPVFAKEQLRPNFVEHALRAWGVDAVFKDPEAMSGAAMRDFLTDHGKYLASWGAETRPLLLEEPQGVAIRWGHESGASVHHDHWLASLTEAGVRRDEPVFTPSRRDMNIDSVLQQSLRDFRLDERETEWSAMAFGLWLPPAKSWTNDEGRQLSFDLLVERLVRGHKRFGVCHGTHRVYSLMLLVRLDDEFDILSDSARADAWAYLENVRDLITACQFPDGHWPSNWESGKAALDKPIDDPEYRKVIATGHHLEWLALAPEELHPPREQILKAADWIIQTTVEQTPEQILERYTFFSHVGNALALWRGTRPSEFWRAWEEQDR